MMDLGRIMVSDYDENDEDEKNLCMLRKLKNI